MSCKLEPGIWSRDTSRQIHCFDGCQLIVTWMPKINEVHSRPRLHVFVYYFEYGRHLTQLRDSVVVMRTRMRFIPPM